jgi:hypothetical protein
VIQNLDGNPVFFGPHEAVGVGAIAEHDLDSRVQIFCLDGIDDGLKIGAAAGNQYADGNLSCHRLALGSQSDSPRSFFDLAN